MRAEEIKMRHDLIVRVIEDRLSTDADVSDFYAFEVDANVTEQDMREFVKMLSDVLDGNAIVYYDDFDYRSEDEMVEHIETLIEPTKYKLVED